MMGGLGNQMFIYVFAKALEMTGKKVVIDGSAYKAKQTSAHPRGLAITDFNLSIPIDIHYRLNKIARFNISYLPFRLFCKKSKDSSYKTSKYRHYCVVSKEMLENENLIKNVAKMHDNTYFRGAFQHLNCFSNIESTIRKEFTLKSPLSNANQKLKEQIMATQDSVFLHIRRGDYLHFSIYVKLGSGYYNGALRAILARVNNPHIFVFSDDVDFAKTHLLKCLDLGLTSRAKWEFISGNENNPVQEIELMRSCKHAIIANSTFSWWAAYLIDNPYKVVTIPSRFFYDETIPKVEYIKPKNYVEIDYNWGFEV